MTGGGDGGSLKVREKHGDSVNLSTFNMGGGSENLLMVVLQNSEIVSLMVRNEIVGEIKMKGWWFCKIVKEGSAKF